MRQLIIVLTLIVIGGCVTYPSPMEVQQQAYQNCLNLGFQPPVEGKWDKSCKMKCYSEEVNCRQDNKTAYCAEISAECLQKCYLKEPEEKYEAQKIAFNNCKLSEFQRLQNQNEQRRAERERAILNSRPTTTTTRCSSDTLGTYSTCTTTSR